MLNVIMSRIHYAKSNNVKCHNAECHYAECHYADCHYAECHYGECHGANSDTINIKTAIGSNQVRKRIVAVKPSGDFVRLIMLAILETSYDPSYDREDFS